MGRLDLRNWGGVGVVLVAVFLAALLAGGLALVLGARPAAATTNSVTAIALASSAGADNEYHAGDTITVRLTFAQAITGHSNAAVTLDIGGAYRSATPDADDDGATLDFKYVVRDDDRDTDGIALATAAPSTVAGTFTHQDGGVDDTTIDLTTLPTTLNAAQANHRVNVNTVDYDTDNDGLIEISSLAQLNAIRWDLDGDGNPVAANAGDYGAAFAGRERHLGCSDGDGTADPCGGYELQSSLNFDTDGDGDVDANDAGGAYWNGGAGWAPIGGTYNTTFRGNGKIIRNLLINRPTESNNGLFDTLGQDAVVTALGIHNASVSGGEYAGILANANTGKIAAVYTTGAVNGGSYAGGLVSRNARAEGDTDGGVIVASYSTASAHVRRINNNYPYAGGLVGLNVFNGTVTASYATGPVTGENNPRLRGLIGRAVSGGSASNSYWDTNTSGQSTSNGGVGQTAANLQGPTAYGSTANDIYAGWDDVDLDGDGTNDDPWDFGTNQQYPRLKWDGLDVGEQLADVTTIAITSDAGSDGDYHTGDVITVRVTLDRAVAVTAGSNAALALTIGSATRNATPAANASGKTLDFAYTVTDGDSDADGIAIGTTALTGAFGRASVDLTSVPDTLAAAQGDHKVNATTVDYDADNDGAGDGLIEIRTLAQLNAIRWDLNGDGRVDSATNAAAYRAAFAMPDEGMGCADTNDDDDPGPCTGYELAANLDFDTDGDGDVDANDAGGAYWNSGAGWAPIGSRSSRYNTTFQGNGKVIDNLLISRSSTTDVGLFGGLGSGARVTALGVRNATVTGQYAVGAVAGYNQGAVAAVYATGSVSGTENIGGLVGYNHLENAKITASYATASVTRSSGSRAEAGGLVGKNQSGYITASYATGAVSASNGGGLVGRNTHTNRDAVDSYWDSQTTGRSIRSIPQETGLNKTTSELQTPTGYTGIYAAWDVNVDTASGNDDPWDFGNGSQYPVLQYGGLKVTDQRGGVESIAISSDAGADLEYHAGDDITVAVTFAQAVTAHTGAALALTIGSATRSATTGATATGETLTFSYTVQAGDADSDGIAIAANALTGSYTYAILGQSHTHASPPLPGTLAAAQGGHRVNVTTVDYDTENSGAGDGLIEVSSLAQLNAMRWDLNGDGAVDSGVSAANAALYAAAFPRRAASMGCQLTDHDGDTTTPEQPTCRGYELMANLDFDTDSDGDVDADDAGGAYWDGGAGWEPIGTNSTNARYNAEFQGNGKVIDNLFINRPTTDNIGLFGALDSDGDITALGIRNASVVGGRRAGILVATVNGAEISAVYTTGAVSARDNLGGLAGYLWTGSVVRASYSTAAVTAERRDGLTLVVAGGLVGFASHAGAVVASYATGPVAGPSGTGVTLGGLVGHSLSASAATESYWDQNTTGYSSASYGTAQTTGALQTPTAYGLATDTPPSIYAGWDLNLDGQTGNDDPWDFGAANQYPRLKYGGLDVAEQLADVTELAIVSDAGSDAEYHAGDTITVRLTFEQDVVPGTGAALALTVGSATRNATPAANAAGRTIDFSYVVGTDDADSDGIAVAATALAGVFGRSSVNYALPTTLAGAQGQHKVNATTTDYDTENGGLGDGLIEVSNLAQLNAMRWDLDGDGMVDSGVSAGDRMKFAMAFPAREASMGCRLEDHDDNTATPEQPTCRGYELMANLDFDTDGSGGADVGDTYWNGGKGWEPIGDDENTVDTERYNAVFQGNGKVIDNLYIRLVSSINDDNTDVGLFGALGTRGQVEALGVRNANVEANRWVGILVGSNYGKIAGAYTTGSVIGGSSTGGLAGFSGGEVIACYSTASVRVETIPIDRYAGALVGNASLGSGTGTITASYATGPVSGRIGIGAAAGGLVGASTNTTVTNSYWDTTTTGVSTAGAGTGYATAALQTPTAYGLATDTPASIYADWNVDVDNADEDDDLTSGVDDPWDFGAANQYPRLKYGGLDVAEQLATVTELAIVSDAGSDEEYHAGDVITVRLTFAQDVVPGAGAAVALTVGSASRNATPAANAAGRTIDFSYTVGTADADSDGIAVGATALAGVFGRSSVNYTLPGTLAGAQGRHKVNVTSIDYDDNDNGLIDIRNLAQLDAMRYDLDGDGAVAAANSAAYAAAFPGRAVAMGCPDTADADTDPGPCLGYELRVDLDFDTNRSGSADSGDTYYNGGAGWAPIGSRASRYNAAFDGNGKVIENLLISRSATNDVGLFGGLGSGARVTGLGIRNATVTGGDNVGILSGWNYGDVGAVYTTGSVSGTENIGGLVGYNHLEDAKITASYATASVTRRSGAEPEFGGLVGKNQSGYITASYATGAVSASNGGGLVGQNTHTNRQAVNSYWDSQTTGRSIRSIPQETGVNKTTSELQTPTGYTGIYADWNVNVDATAGVDDPWDFGTSSQYPRLKYGGLDVDIQATKVDYDTDSDGLIEIRTLPQLNAVRYDLDGNGDATTTEYTTAFKNAVTGMGCPATGCVGYELMADLDFDTNGNGYTYTLDAAGTATGDSGDLYYNGGKGWVPLGQVTRVGIATRIAGRYAAVFKGNGHTIANLYVNDGHYGNQGFGFFSELGTRTAAARVEGLGLVNVYVRGHGSVGGLAAAVNSSRSDGYLLTTAFNNVSVVVGSYVTGRVIAIADNVGGLVGDNVGVISASYARAAVTGNDVVGGLVGINSAGIVYNSYAAGPVNATIAAPRHIGGLAGNSTINSVTPFADGFKARNSYWDVYAGCEHIRRTDSGAYRTYGLGKTTAELMAPGGYTGIYAGWGALYTGHNVSTASANPWTFRAGRYPVLNYAGHDATEQFDGQRIDYDCDDDGLIEVNDLADLDVMRHDLDGDGEVADANGAAYGGAYPIAAAGMGCPLADHDADGDTAPVRVCTGYELGANVRSEVAFDFDTNGSGGANAGDTYWNGGSGWLPIGSGAAPWTAAFRGNGHDLANLYIDRDGAGGSDDVGLFAAVGSAGTVSGVTLSGANVAGRDRVGAVVGQLDGTLDGVGAAGAVSGRDYVGGIAGRAAGAIRGAALSGATTTVAGTDYVGGIVGQAQAGGSVVNSYAGGSVSGTDYVGGIAGAVAAAVTTPEAVDAGRIEAAWSGAAVTGTDYVGGIAGEQLGTLAAVYAVGTVTGTTNTGGVAGATATGATATGAWFDEETTGQTASPGGGAAQSTRALMTPTAYGSATDTPPSIYAAWNLDIDGVTGADDPWDFGSATQYPALKQGGHNAATQRGLHPPPSTDARLSGLTVSGTTLNETFDPDTTTYTADVGFGTAQVTVAATPRRSMATAAYSGTDADGGTAGHQVDLAHGSNTVTVTVTPHDETAATQDYTITIMRDAGIRYTISSPAADSVVNEGGNLNVTVTGSRAPGAAAGDVLCTITPDTSSSRVGTDGDDFTATTATASFGAAATTGTCEFSVAQDNDHEPVEYFTVTLSSPAANAIASATYGAGRNFRIAASDVPSSDATLSSLGLTGITLSPETFSADTLDYTAEVGNTVAQVTVTYTVGGVGATATVTPADADTNTAGHQVDLNVGDNSIAVAVTAADGTTATYRIAVYRQGAADTLRSLTITGSDGNRYDLVPSFTPTRVSPDTYTVTVPRGNTSVRVAAQQTSGTPGISITVIGSSTVGLSISPSNTYNVPLGNPGVTTTFTLTVTATVDGSASSKTYRVAVTHGTAADYDEDNDGLIDITTLAQLNAVRYDMDGDGIPTDSAMQPVPQQPTITAAYSGASGAFQHAMTGMGCPATGCIGYELLADLDFDSDGDGDVDANDHGGAYWNGGRGWVPIGIRTGSTIWLPPSRDFNIPAYTAEFKGNGHTISNLYINDSSTNGSNVGLFSQLGEYDDAALVEGVGLVDVYINGNSDVGGLAGLLLSSQEFRGTGSDPTVFTNYSRVIGSYVTGTVIGSGSRIGGLVGYNYGLISASYSRAAVTGYNTVGGLVGYNHNLIYNSYAAGPVKVTTEGETVIGGLAGVSQTDSGNLFFGQTRVFNSYWDVHAGCERVRWTSAEGYAAYGRGKTTAELMLTGYTGIYADWNNLYTTYPSGTDSDNANPWTFRAGQYPVLNYGDHDTDEQFDAQRIDYDCDDDGLIEVNDLADLDVVRYDLDGNGDADAMANDATYAGAYPIQAAGMGCALGDHDNDANTAAAPYCRGYELGANGSSAVALDFDTNGSGGPDAGDTYWNGGLGWLPIGPGINSDWRGVFNGNGNEIRNLHINRATQYSGLFGVVGIPGRVEGVALVGASVTSTMSRTGALAGRVSSGTVTASYSTGAVSGTTDVGGLVGYLDGSASATGTVSASYSSAAVVGNANVGGLVGNSVGMAAIAASYAYGAVTGMGDTPTGLGGLLGAAGSGGTVTASYYDSEVADSDGGEGGGGAAQTRRALQEPAGATYAGIYASWDVDVDGVSGGDDPWRFGNADQFPVLRAFGHDTAAQFRIQPPLSSVATLASITTVPVLTLDPVFAADTTSYTGTLADASVGYITVSAAASDGLADVTTISPADSRAGVDGHQVDLAAGSNTITITVRAQNGATTSYTITVPLTARDHDSDNDGLIEIHNLAQLDAVRYDLDGDGAVDDRANDAAYRGAFGRAVAGMGCPDGDHDGDVNTPDAPHCTGYELMASLDFDTDGSGEADAGDTYWNGGVGWTPIGGVSTGHPSLNAPTTAYSGEFNGNGYTISNLYINRSSDSSLGLFGALSGSIEQVGLVNASVVSGSGAALGTLIGYANYTSTTVTACYVQGGEVRGHGWAGGLVGYNRGTITASYADVAVRASAATGQRGLKAVGGLVGANGGTVTYSYAMGKPVIDLYDNYHNNAPAYAGGLTGYDYQYATEVVTNSHWDTTRTGTTTSFTLPDSAGLKTYQLRQPVTFGAAAGDTYYGWDLDLNNDGTADDTWDFGNSTQYPALKYGGHSSAGQFERQPRIGTGNTLTALSTTPAQTLAPTFDAASGGPYGVPVELEVNSVTVNYTPVDADDAAITPTVSITPADADGNAAGYQIDTTTPIKHTVTLVVNGQDGSASTYTLNLNKGAPNADAGGDQVVDEDTLVTLDGTGSSDPHGQALTYLWEQTAGATVTLSSTTATMPTFTAPMIASASSPDIVLTFRLTVTDTDMLTGTDEVTVTVTKQATVSSVSIVSTAGGTVASTYVRNEAIDVAVQFSEIVAVDIGGGRPRLALTIGSATRNAEYASGTGTNTLTFRYTVQAGDADTDGVSIAADVLALNGGTIKDLSGLAADLSHSLVAASASHKVDGSQSTNSPTANAGADRVVASGSTVTLAGSGSDPNGDGLTYLWAQTAGATVALSSATAAQPTFTAPDIANAGDADLTLTFRLTVTDDSVDAFSATDAVEITVTKQAAVIGISISSTTGITRTNTYVRAETISAAVQFSESVNVDTTGGTPRVGLTVGTTTRYANYASGTGTDTLTFSYAVQSGDSDTDGVSIAANALSLNGGTIEDASELAADLRHSLVAASDSHKVNGSIAIGTPTANAGIDKVVAAGKLARLDGRDSSSPYDNPLLTYTWSRPPGGTIVNTGTWPPFTAPDIVNASDPDLTWTFRLTLHDVERNLTDTDEVTFTISKQATVTSIGISSTADGTVANTYVANEAIEVAVRFSEIVNVDTTGGTPRVALAIGRATRYAEYVSGSGTVTLTFRYTVRSGDEDTDGVSIGANALSFNGGTIKDASTLAADLDHSAEAADANHKVDGSQSANNPTANAGVDQAVEPGDAVTLSGSATDPNGDAMTYAWTQTAGVTVALSSASAEEPTFTAPPIIGSPGADITLTFRFTATDTNGDSGSDMVTVTVTRQATISSVTISSTPGTTVANTYTRGETISAEVQFSEIVNVTTTGGTPRVGLTIGATTRYANYASGGGTDTLTFSYTVQSGDADSDGVSIGADALELNGGTIKDAPGLAADLDHSAVDASSSHLVDGSTSASHPTANAGIDAVRAAGAVVTLSGSGSDPNAGQTATLTYAWTQTAPTTGTGSGLTITNSNAATASFTAPSITGSDVDLTFQLMVTDSDNNSDTDDVTITISPQATVTSITISSTPGTTVTNTYTRGETISVQAQFSEVVNVDTTGGTPRVGLTIGTTTRYANYASGTGTNTLTFSYVVQSGDADTDGVSIAVDALELNGGTIEDASELAADLDHSAVAASASHLVDGSIATGTPTANAGGDQVVGGGDTATLRGSGSDPNGDTLTYAWSQTAGSTVALSSTSAAQPTFTAPGRNAGDPDLTLTFSLTVTDDSAANLSATDTVDVTVTRQATVSSVSISSTAGTTRANNYVRGEDIEVEVGFSESVTVDTTDGTPRVALTIGSTTRYAGYTSGTGTTTLTFSYTVQAGDEDTDGVSIAADALDLDGGTIEDASELAADLDHSAEAASDSHKVNGNIATGTPTANAGGDQVVGGGDTATLRGSGSDPNGDTLTYAWSQTAGSTVALSSTSAAQPTFTAPGRNAGDPDLTLTFSLTVTDAPSNGNSATDTVDVTVTRQATVSDVSIGGDVGDTVADTYVQGETIEVEVEFSESVTVTGTPQLTIAGGGSNTYTANYESGSGTDTLTFEYTVQSADADSDGISIAANALSLNGGTIADASGLAAALGLGSHAVANDDDYKVDGSVTIASGTPSADAGGDQVVESGATGVTLDGIGSSDPDNQTLTYLWEQTAGTTVTLSSTTAAQPTFTAPTITGSPGADIDLTFRLTVTDTANLTDTDEVTVTVTLQATVNGVSIGGGVGDTVADTYVQGETIEVEVEFSESVTVTGTPQLTIAGGGSNTYTANYESGSGTDTLTFEYTVQSADADSDGISIAAGALSLNGGTIADASGLAAALGLGSHAVANDNDYKVDGSVTIASGTPIADAGDDQAVAESGAVTLDGTGSRDPHGQTLTYLWEQTAPTSGAGSNRTLSSATAARPTFTAPGIANANDADIDLTFRLTVTDTASPGLTATDDVTVTVSKQATVSSVSIASTPQSDSTYGAGETITVSVLFTENVTVTGAPRVALTVGSATRDAAYTSGSGTSTLTFSYTVQSGDSDTDGVSIAADALSLNGGTIADASGLAADLSHSAEAASASHLVAGGSTAAAPVTVSPTVSVSVSAVSIVSSPESGDTYGAGETIQVRVTFSAAVTASGNPRLRLAIGSASATRDARLVGRTTDTTTLTFAYTVAAEDSDADGISIAANALSGGTIRGSGAGGGLATRHLGSHAISNADGHKVDGSISPTPAVRGVSILSTPQRESTYGASEIIRVAVDFDREMTVSGAPTLSLVVGSVTRAAAYRRTAGTSLIFEYIVQPSDRDDDGISIAADALALPDGATIRSASGNDADLDLGSHALTNDGGHKVDGRFNIPPRITRIHITSAPLIGDTYGLGETLQLEANFSKAITVTGNPQLALAVGSGQRQAAYAGAESSVVKFGYAVDAGDRDANGISIPANALRRNGADIHSSVGSVDADLDSSRVVANPSHRVDGSVNRRGTIISVSRTDGAPAGVIIFIPDPQPPITPTVILRPASGVPTTGARFALGSDAARIIVDITVEDAPVSGMEVCLPVTSALRGEARSAGEDLKLLRYTGAAWTEVAGSRDFSSHICAAGVNNFSAFAAGYEQEPEVPPVATPTPAPMPTPTPGPTAMPTPTPVPTPTAMPTPVPTRTSDANGDSRASGSGSGGAPAAATPVATPQPVPTPALATPAATLPAVTPRPSATMAPELRTEMPTPTVLSRATPTATPAPSPELPTLAPTFAPPPALLATPLTTPTLAPTAIAQAMTTPTIPAPPAPATPEPAPPAATPAPAGGGGAGLAAGIAVGAILVIAILAGVVFLRRRRRAA